MKAPKIDMKFPGVKINITAPAPQRLQMLLLLGVAVLLVAHVSRVRPMQAEMEDILTSIESESAAPTAPAVAVEDAAYAASPEKALSLFYLSMEARLKSAGLNVESRQIRIEPDPRYPATPLV